MSWLHHRIRRRFRWYDRWHTHPPHELYHWALFLAALSVVTVYTFTRIGRTLAEIDSISHTPVIMSHSLLRGGVVGEAPDQILVQFRAGINQSDRERVATRQRLTAKTVLPQLGIEIFSVAAGDSPRDAVLRLQKQEGGKIEFAEVDARIAPSLLPNDPTFLNQWHLAQINAPLAWDTTTGKNSVIAIADSGVEASHPDLQNHLIPGWNFFNNNSDTGDVYGHGTAVAGAAAAIGNNALDVASVGFDASLMPLRVTDTAGYGYYSTIAQAVAYAADHGAKVVNVSFEIGSSATIERAAKYLWRKGGMIVAAAGNSSIETANGNVREIVFAAATDGSDERLPWSNYGSGIDVTAPGVAIFTTARGGQIGLYSGTSFSAPLTAGVLSLIWAVNPNFTPNEAQAILFDSAQELGSPGWDPYYGWGRIDAGRAIDLAIRRSSMSASNPSKKKP